MGSALNHHGWEEALAALCRRAREEQPGLGVSDEALRAFVAARVEGVGSDVGARALAGLHAGDLLLACGCEAGEPEACRRFVALCGPVARAAAARHAGLSSDDVMTLVFERLFLGRGRAQPKIVHYRGTGRLATWVRVVAVRLVANVRRDARRHEVDEAILVERVPMVAEGDDLSRRYRHEVKVAIHEALGALSARDRNLLRYQLVDGLSSTKIAALCDVHPVTVQRWQARVLKELRGHTRRLLAGALGLSAEALDSLVSVADSSWQLSLSRAFADYSEASEPQISSKTER